MTDDPRSRWQDPSRWWTHGELAGRPPAGHSVDPRNENDESRSRAEGDGASAPAPPSVPGEPSLAFDEASEHAVHHRALTPRHPCSRCGAVLLGPLCSRCAVTDTIFKRLAKPPNVVALAVAGFPPNLVTEMFASLDDTHFVPHPDGCPRCGAYPGVPCIRLTDDHPKPGETHVHRERRSGA